MKRDLDNLLDLNDDARSRLEPLDKQELDDLEAQLDEMDAE